MSGDPATLSDSGQRQVLSSANAAGGQDPTPAPGDQGLGFLGAAPPLYDQTGPLASAVQNAVTDLMQQAAILLSRDPTAFLPAAGLAGEELAAGESAVAGPLSGQAAENDVSVAVNVLESNDIAEFASASPQSAGLLTDASPFDLASLEAALQQALDQVADLGRQVQSWLAQLGPVPWVCLGLAVTAAAWELCRRRREQLLILVAASADEWSRDWLPDADDNG